MAHSIQKVETKYPVKAPYSPAILVPAGQQLIFVSGQLPVDPATDKLIEGDIVALTMCVLDNMEAILKQAGSSLKHVVRTDVFLINMKRDFAGMNEAYAKRFSVDTPPARQTVQVVELPKGATIEISCIAIAHYLH